VTLDELREEISIELELMDAVVREVTALRRDVTEREPTVREKTAAAAFLAQFYSGVENILKRIHRFHKLQLPSGDTWHTDLYRRFCDPPYGDLPLLFDEMLAGSMAPYRKFRHVVYHGYGFQMDWERMNAGIGQIGDVFSRFKAKLSDYMEESHE
jgi:hypothetical protein